MVGYRLPIRSGCRPFRQQYARLRASMDRQMLPFVAIFGLTLVPAKYVRARMDGQASPLITLLSVLSGLGPGLYGL
jgi:hypothetical protein